jgi:biopolymer transport protein ExbD
VSAPGAGRFPPGQVPDDSSPSIVKLESQLQLSPRFMHLVPFLGVVMLLLTFFLLGSSMVMQSGVRVRPPTTASLLEPMPQAQVITVTAGRQPAIYFNEQPVTLAELKEILDQPRKGQRQALIRADELAAYGAVITVSQLATEAGYEVVLASAPPDVPATQPPP